MKYIILTRRGLTAITAVTLSALLIVFGICGRKSALSSAAAEEGKRLLPIYCVETDEKKIAVTFDAAWGADDTERLIEILKNHNAKATFFVVGEWAEKYPDSVKAFYASGHEIGNHSASHNMYSSLTESEIIKDITLCNEAVKKAIGVTPVLLRAPSGDYTNDTITAATKLNMKTIQWSVDSLDWKGLDTDEIVKRVTDKTECGSIILFHNDIKNTPDALDRILTELEKKGYSFVTVSELIYDGDYKIDSAGKQIKNAAANWTLRRIKNSIGKFIRKIRFYLSLYRIKNL